MSNKSLAIIVAVMNGGTGSTLALWLIRDVCSTNRSVVVNSMAGPSNALQDIDRMEGVGESKSNSESATIIPSYHVISEVVREPQLWQSAVIELSVSMDECVTREKLRLLLQYLDGELMKRGPFKYRAHPNLIVIFVHVRPGQHYVAKGIRADESEFKIVFEEDLLEIVSDPPVAKFGLTELERQEVFRDIVRAEDRGTVEAEEAYPYPRPGDPRYSETGYDNQIKARNRHCQTLTTKYKAMLADHVGLTKKQLDAIGNEGVRSRWTMPTNPNE